MRTALHPGDLEGLGQLEAGRTELDEEERAVSESRVLWAYVVAPKHVGHPKAECSWSVGCIWMGTDPHAVELGNSSIPSQGSCCHSTTADRGHVRT